MITGAMTNTFINKCLESLPKMEYLTARSVIMDLYDMEFGIANHAAKDADPLLSSLLRTTNPFRSEDVMMQSSLRDFLQNFPTSGISDFWKLSLLETLSLPWPVYEMMEQLLPELHKKRKAEMVALDDKNK